MSGQLECALDFAIDFLRAVLIRWQLAHTTSHFSSSAKRNSLR